MMDKYCRNYLVRKNTRAQCWGTLSRSGSLVPAQEPRYHLTFMPLSDIKIALCYETPEQWAVCTALVAAVQCVVLCSWWEQHKACLECCRGRALVLATVFTPIIFIICIWAAQTSPCYKWKVSLKARAFSVPSWMFLISARSMLQFLHRKVPLESWNFFLVWCLAFNMTEVMVPSGLQSELQLRSIEKRSC